MSCQVVYIQTLHFTVEYLKQTERHLSFFTQFLTGFIQAFYLHFSELENLACFNEVFLTCLKAHTTAKKMKKWILYMSLP